MKSIFSLFLLLFFFTTSALAQTSGQLNVSVSTSHAGGNYKPKNIVAIWIENSEGSFIKTLLVYADKRKTHLNTWQASTKAAGTEYNKTDAVSGATVNSHATRTCSWNGKDFNGNSVPDGEYKVWMELTDKNSTGNYSSFSFNKGQNPQQLNPDDVPSFSSINISWDPSGTSPVFSVNDEFDYYVFPNPVSKKLNLSSQPLEDFRIVNMMGETVYAGNEQSIDFSEKANGSYFLIFKNKKTLSFGKN